MSDDPRRVIVDTDTAGDDAQALLLAAASERVEMAGVTVCSGNVQFEHQVENAKYTLDLAGVAEDVTVYEGATEPLLATHEYADYVHGEGGLGGDLFPDTGIPSGDQFAPDFIVEQAREHPGELTLACIAPLTNVAVALQKEPALGDLLADVWVMGGNANCLGNVTPAAEYNFWVDPHAARKVLDEMDVTLFDWGVTVRDTVFDRDTLEEFERVDTPLGEFFSEISVSVRAFNEDVYGEDVTTQPDSGMLAALVEPSLVESSGRYYVQVDDREGLTRGYTLVDENGVTGEDPGTTVVEAFDNERFVAMTRAMLHGRPPESALE